MKPDTPKRLSLTRTDAKTSTGLELLELLQVIADDGQLTRDEVDRLSLWLIEHPDFDHPARALLRSSIDEVLKDGIITDQEYEFLHEAVLRVLPTDLRSLASLRRRERKARTREEKRHLRDEEREQKKIESERNAPIQHADFMVAGATRGSERRDACEACAPGDRVWLEREPDNEADPNAVLVQDESGDSLGYVPKEYARDFAPLLDSGARQDFVIKKCLATASGATIPVVVGSLYRADSSKGREGKQRPTRLPPAKQNVEATEIVANGERSTPRSQVQYLGGPIQTEQLPAGMQPRPRRVSWWIVAAIVVIVLANVIQRLLR